jgi:hypothetical protein
LLEYIGKLVRYSTCFENREYYHSQLGTELPVKTPFFITPKRSLRLATSSMFIYQHDQHIRVHIGSNNSCARLVAGAVI